MIIAIERKIQTYQLMPIVKIQIEKLVAVANKFYSLTRMQELKASLQIGNMVLWHNKNA